MVMRVNAFLTLTSSHRGSLRVLSAVVNITLLAWTVKSVCLFIMINPGAVLLLLMYMNANHVIAMDDQINATLIWNCGSKLVTAVTA